MQYADFAVWQRGWLAGEVLERSSATGGSASPARRRCWSCPRTGRGRRSQSSARGGAARSRCRRRLARAAAQALARQEGATLFMTLLAAFQALLGRYAAQDDLVVGTPIAGRTRAEMEGADRLLRQHAGAAGGPVGRRPASASCSARVREVALGAYAHQDLPFEKLVEELAPERDLGRTPLFQVLFVAAERPADAEPGSAGWRCSRWCAGAGDAPSST